MAGQSFDTPEWVSRPGFLTLHFTDGTCDERKVSAIEARSIIEREFAQIRLGSKALRSVSFELLDAPND